MFHRIYSHFPIQTLSTIHLEHLTLSLYRPRCSTAFIRIFRSKPLAHFIWNILPSLSIGPDVPECRNSYLLHENSTTIECRVDLHVNCSRYTSFAYKTVHSHARTARFLHQAWAAPSRWPCADMVPDGVLAMQHLGCWLRSGQRCRRRRHEVDSATPIRSLCGAHHAACLGVHCIATCSWQGQASIARAMRRPCLRRSTVRHTPAPSQAATGQRSLLTVVRTLRRPLGRALHRSMVVTKSFRSPR
jgi:hypothetical protein